MTIITISPETREIEVREGFKLALPKFLWAVLEARARTMYQGDLHTAIMELVAEELLGWFVESVRGVVGPVTGNN